MSEPRKIGRLDDFPIGEGVVVESDLTGVDSTIAVFRVDDAEIYAIDDTCTHEDASLAEGWVDDCEVECPLHSAAFCLKTGEALSLPATTAVRTYTVEIRGEDVWLIP